MITSILSPANADGLIHRKYSKTGLLWDRRPQKPVERMPMPQVGLLGTADSAPMAGGGGHQDYGDQKENYECPLGAKSGKAHP